MRQLTTGIVMAAALVLCGSIAHGGWLEARNNYDFYMFATSDVLKGSEVGTLADADYDVSAHAFLGRMTPNWNGVDITTVAVLSTSTVSAAQHVRDFLSTDGINPSTDVISVYDMHNRLIGRWNAPSQTETGVVPGNFSAFAPVTYDENGFLEGPTRVWTGSNPDGTFSGFDASDWTSNSGFATYGVLNASGPGLLNTSNFGDAGTENSLYGLIPVNNGGGIGGFAGIDGTVNVWVPEPSTLVLLSIGANGLALASLLTKSRYRGSKRVVDETASDTCSSPQRRREGQVIRDDLGL